MCLDRLIWSLLSLIDAQRAMSLVMNGAVHVKGTRSCHPMLLDLTAIFPMPQNLVHAWTHILRYGVHLSVARTIQSP